MNWLQFIAGVSGFGTARRLELGNDLGRIPVTGDFSEVSGRLPRVEHSGVDLQLKALFFRRLTVGCPLTCLDFAGYYASWETSRMIFRRSTWPVETSEIEAGFLETKAAFLLIPKSLNLDRLRFGAC